MRHREPSGECPSSRRVLPPKPHPEDSGRAWGLPRLWRLGRHLRPSAMRMCPGCRRWQGCRRPGIARQKALHLRRGLRVYRVTSQRNQQPRQKSARRVRWMFRGCRGPGIARQKALHLRRGLRVYRVTSQRNQQPRQKSACRVRWAPASERRGALPLRSNRAVGAAVWGRGARAR